MDLVTFREMESAYKEKDRESLRQGRLPLRPTPRGFWSPAIMAEVFEAFRDIGLDRYRSFLDLGSGDGRVVLIASLFVPRAEGIEIDPRLHAIAVSMAKKFGNSAAFRLMDMFQHDISPYDVLFLSPDTPLERGMERKLVKEMNGHLILSGDHFYPRTLVSLKSRVINGTRFSVYGKTD